jgi:hypothetical protein
LGPSGPSGFPFNETVIPPAFPTRSVTVLLASIMRLSLAAKVAEKEALPSLRAEIQTGSVAVS